jgi:uncharacterized protein
MGVMSQSIGPVRRLAFVSGGLVCVGLGGLGLVVPGLPATIFFILAAACFSRSHPRLEQWVLDLPKVGPTVRDYRAGLGMPRRAKQWAIGSIVVFSTISVVLVDVGVVRLTIAAVAATGVWFVGWRVPTAATDRP